MSAASTIPSGAGGGDEDAWLYESKEADAPPPGDDSSQEPGVPGEDSQEEEQVTLVEEPHGEKANGKSEQVGKEDLEEGEDEDDDDDEEDDDEDDIEVTIGDTKSAPVPPGGTATAASGGIVAGAPVNLNIKKSIGGGTTAVSGLGAPGGQIVKQTHKGLDIDAVASIHGTNIYEFNIDSLEEKPWRKPGADITDYFNYGFTEETWKIYCDRQRRLRGDNNIQGVKSMVNQVPSTMSGPGGGYEKYRPSYGGSRDPKESYGGGPRGGMGMGGSKRETGGTIDVIGANSNSRRLPQGPPPPLDDSGPPPPMMGGPPNDMPPHYPGQFANVGHPMPPYDPHSMPPPPFNPRFPPPGGLMPSPLDGSGMPPAPFDPYGGPMGLPPPPMPNMPPPIMPVPGDFRGSGGAGAGAGVGGGGAPGVGGVGVGGPGVVGDDSGRMSSGPPPMDDLAAEYDRRRHHRSRDDRDDRDYREERERRHRERERERESRDDRRDREDRRERDRGDRERERSDRDRSERDRDNDRHRSSRKSRRHDEEEDDRRSSKHKRSKRDDDS